MIITQFNLFNESVNYGVVYHILDFEKLKYVIENNHLKTYRASHKGGISTTRNKMMNSYLGDGPTAFIKLELDASKLSSNYKIKPVTYTSYTNVRLHEYEEVILTKYKPINNIKKYVNKLILIKENIEKLRKSWREDDAVSDYFTTAGTRNGTMKEMIQWIVDNSPYDIWVQEGSSIKKDDEYINSLTSQELENVTFKYDIWYRGYIKNTNIKHGYRDVIIDSAGGQHSDWVVGHTYEGDFKLKEKGELDLNQANKEIDEETFRPYFLKFRILKDGSQYLEDAFPLYRLKDN
jgi:hypothetical protein